MLAVQQYFLWVYNFNNIFYIPSNMPIQIQVQQTSKVSNLQSTTILLIFLIIVINQIFLISLFVVLLKKIKHVFKSPAKKYYIFVVFYIVTKIALCVFLQIKILTGMSNDFKDIQSQDIQNIFDNSLVFADCSIVELFLVSFEHYIALSFSVFGNKKVERTIRVLMKGVQLLAFLIAIVPLILFNIKLIHFYTLNVFTMCLNCLSVVVFIAAFFFMNFKMTGLMMDRRSSQIIKRVYALLVGLLISRLVMSVLEVWVQINITNGSFEDFISVIEKNQKREVVLGLCFILYLVVFLLSEGLPLIMSLRENVVAAIISVQKQRSRSSSLQDSLITDSLDVREQLFGSIIQQEQEMENENKSKNKSIPDSYYGLSKIQDPQQLEIVQKIQVVSQDFLSYKAKWSRNNRFYFVRQFGKISNYIIEQILNEIQKFIMADIKVINTMKILEKSNEQTILIIQKYLCENLEKKMQNMVQQNASLKQKIIVAIKIAKAIKQFHETLKIGHGVINPKNILFDDEGSVYLTGFGMESLKKYLSLTTQYSNISLYTAVELFGSARQKTITKPHKTADIYSFGIILYEIASNNFKYRNLSLTQIRNKFEKQNTRPKIPQNMNEDLKKIMRKCWQEKPQNRPQMNWIISTLQSVKANL